VKLPADLSGQELRQAREKAGFTFRRQKGSHMILRRDLPCARVVVPDHRRIRLGTLRQILHEAGLSVEKLKELL
jgi:predicted RNA binding protein YcfA (HicA-like mRNA interferase family)